MKFSRRTFAKIGAALLLGSGALAHEKRGAEPSFAFEIQGDTLIAKVYLTNVGQEGLEILTSLGGDSTVALRVFLAPGEELAPYPEASESSDTPWPVPRSGPRRTWLPIPTGQKCLVGQKKFLLPDQAKTQSGLLSLSLQTGQDQLKWESLPFTTDVSANS